MRYETLAEDKGIEFTTDLMENCPYTWANADRVEQILTNFAGQCVQIHPARGRVWIETQVQNRKDPGAREKQRRRHPAGGSTACF